MDCSDGGLDDLGMCPADMGADMAAASNGNPAANGVPLACDGGLCDTTNSSTITSLHCGATVGGGRGGDGSALALCGLMLVVALLAARRRVARRLAAVAALLIAHSAAASPPPSMDVSIEEPPPPQRYVTLTWNPLWLTINRTDFSVVVTPVAHHALVVSPSYFSLSTAPIFTYDDQQNPTVLPRQHFVGWGGEIGYRYYFGQGGPRGWWVGPSFLLTHITATAANGDETSYMKYGGAIDGGYQMLLWSRVSVGLGLGVQYTRTDKDIPKQQFPALLLVNTMVFPRFLFSLGVAL